MKITHLLALALLAKEIDEGVPKEYERIIGRHYCTWDFPGLQLLVFCDQVSESRLTWEIRQNGTITSYGPIDISVEFEGEDTDLQLWKEINEAAGMVSTHAATALIELMREIEALTGVSQSHEPDSEQQAEDNPMTEEEAKRELLDRAMNPNLDEMRNLPKQAEEPEGTGRLTSPEESGQS